MRIRLSDELGRVLVGRFPAVQLREHVEDLARRGETVVLDFAGVDVLSPSFADEVFARLDPLLVEAGLIKLENVDDDLLEVASFLRRARAAS
jgi:hypothetical protein